MPVPTVLTVLNAALVAGCYIGTYLGYVPPIVGYSLGGAGLVTLPFMIALTWMSMDNGTWS